MDENGLALNDVFRVAYFFTNPFRSGLVEKLNRECKIARAVLPLKTPGV